MLENQELFFVVGRHLSFTATLYYNQVLISIRSISISIDYNPQQPIQPTQAAPVQQPAPQPMPQPMPQLMPQQPSQVFAPPVGAGKKKLPKVVKAIMVVASIFILAWVALIVSGVVTLKNNDKEVQGFLSAIYASDYSTAYDYYATELKEMQTKSTFESQFQAMKTLGLDDSCKAKWTNTSIRSSTDEGSFKEIGGALDCDKRSFSASFDLFKQGDAYKIYSYSIQPK